MKAVCEEHLPWAIVFEGEWATCGDCGVIVGRWNGEDWEWAS